MNFNYLELEDLKKSFPNKPDINNEIIKNENYIKLYNIYRNFFSQYFIKVLNLKNKDNIIKESNLDFKKINSKDMDMYQYFTKEELDYIYLRNNIYIEKLNSEELDFLNKYITYDDLKLDEQIERFIKNTFEKVIFEDITGDNKIAYISYGTDSFKYYLKNNSLVIGLREDTFFKGELTDKEWFEQHKKKNEFLNVFINNMESEFRIMNIDIPIRVLVYSEYSVKKR